MLQSSSATFLPHII